MEKTQECNQKMGSIGQQQKYLVNSLLVLWLKI